MGRLAVRLLVSGFLALAAIAGAAAIWGHDRFTRSGPLARDTTVIIPKGAGPEAIAGRLIDQGVIADRLVFVLGARLTGRDRRMRAGEYGFRAKVSVRSAIAVLVSGQTVKRRLTIAEGLTTAQVLALIAAADALDGAVPGLPGEGALLPETYFFSYGDDRGAIVERMKRAMDETLARLWATRAPGLAFRTSDEALVLASIIEKETAVDRERARVSAVFHNRLRRGMRLQSDPTVAYAITGSAAILDRKLTRRDLSVRSPYNTYRVAGLPPGPIANPGRASIAASLNPADSKDLYFVADGKGGHVFARTLAEHNRNVAVWRKLRRRDRDRK